MPLDPDHPRPQLQRDGWFRCDGTWEFALDSDGKYESPADVVFDQQIIVPFAPETKASGIAAPGRVRRCWYRKHLTLPATPGAMRWRLHFGAVDRIATIWIDGQLAARHEGGYTPFSVDIPALSDGAVPQTVEVVVRAEDDPFDFDVPHGKQEWLDEPHAIWYPRTTGIWQSVWCEPLPRAWIASVWSSGDPSTMGINVHVELNGSVPPNSSLGLRVRHGERLVVDDHFRCGESLSGRLPAIRRTVFIGQTTIDDVAALVWRPHNPTLLDVELTLVDPDGTVIDAVASYTAIRSVAIEDGRFMLNGRPRVLRMALDQGYWEESGYTAPSLEALVADVELALAMGFNGVRKHQKIEDPRWLFACDRLGLMVWEELPSAYMFTERTLPALTREWIDVVQRDRNHPCIVAWVPFNESWGVPDPVNDPAQRAAISALAHLTKALDPTRPVSANDGWETVGGDIIGIHDYDQDPNALRDRYATRARIEELLEGFGPARRRLTADGSGIDGRAVLVTEMGGTTFAPSANGIFGYGNVTSPGELLDRVRSLVGAVLSSDWLSSFCWTQLVDTYQEANGLARINRTPKVDLNELRAAIQGR